VVSNLIYLSAFVRYESRFNMFGLQCGYTRINSGSTYDSIQQRYVCSTFDFQLMKYIVNSAVNVRYVYPSWISHASRSFVYLCTIVYVTVITVAGQLLCACPDLYIFVKYSALERAHVETDERENLFLRFDCKVSSNQWKICIRYRSLTRELFIFTVYPYRNVAGKDIM
jgi:hypothetical protein